MTMAFTFSLISLVFCFFAVEAFPKLRAFPKFHAFPKFQAFPKFRRNQDVGYVVYTLPKRCVSPPSDPGVNYCNVEHEIAQYRSRGYAAIVSPIRDAVQAQNSPECAGAIKKLLCQNSFPACLPDNQEDYGDKQAAFDAVKQSCSFGSHLLQGPQFQSMKSGVQVDPYAAYYSLHCRRMQQDPKGECPEPEYKVPAYYVRSYPGIVRKVTRTLAEEPDIPEECYQTVKNVFACSYPICSADEKSILMTMTREKCFELRACFQQHGKYSSKVEHHLREGCVNYPVPSTDNVQPLPPPSLQ